MGNANSTRKEDVAKYHRDTDQLLVVTMRIGDCEADLQKALGEYISAMEAVIVDHRAWYKSHPRANRDQWLDKLNTRVSERELVFGEPARILYRTLADLATPAVQLTGELEDFSRSRRLSSADPQKPEMFATVRTMLLRRIRNNLDTFNSEVARVRRRVKLYESEKLYVSRVTLGMPPKNQTRGSLEGR